MISIILIKEARLKVDQLENIHSGNINYTGFDCFLLSLLGFTIGFGGILFGLAGGAIINPLLILIGFDPLVLLYHINIYSMLLQLLYR